MDDISINISPTDEIPETDSYIYTPSSFSMDDLSITISPTDEILETDSFIYNPSFASSETSISTSKTERTINSYKSSYNALHRRKYGLPNGHMSSDVDSPKVSYWSLAYGRLHYRHFSGCVWTAPPRRVNTLRRCWSFRVAGGGTEGDTD